MNPEEEEGRMNRKLERQNKPFLDLSKIEKVSEDDDPPASNLEKEPGDEISLPKLVRTKAIRPSKATSDPGAASQEPREVSIEQKDCATLSKPN